MTGRRYLTLDAVRGVAALSVFCLHAGALINPVRVPHAYLAVDLFFLLSGFVIDHVYGWRLATGMTARAFVVARYIRLYPLYLVGFAIGALASAAALVMGQGVLSARDYAIAFAAGLLMLPSPTWHADAMLVPFNYPAWSLLCEMVINIVYALTFRWWRLPILLPVVLVSAAGLCWIAWTYGSVDYGAYWWLLWVGLVRVTFAFTLGVVLRRLWDRPARHTRLAWLAPLVALPLLYGFGGSIGDLLTILLLFPLLILLAAAVEPSGAGRGFVLLGTLSYPLYVIHIPIVQALERALTVLHLPRAAMAPWAGLALALMLASLALALDRWYDVPVRRRLTRLLGPKPAAIDRGL